jgi:SAM-dependent methyltransferase
MDESEVWDEVVGDAWVRHADLIDAQSSAFGEAAMDALALPPGASVLDIGCGTGTTTMQLADRVGSSGRVLGVDLSSRMLARARERAADRPNVTFAIEDASSMVVDAPFDALFSRNGVMFFDDPLKAFSHLRSLVAPGGRLAFCCWKDPFSNPWMSVPMMASIPVLGPPDIPGPGKPGPFAFASADDTRAMLTQAGWSAVSIDELSVERPYMRGTARDAASAAVEVSPPFALALRARPELHDELVDAIATAMREHERDGVVVFQMTSWIVTATA